MNEYFRQLWSRKSRRRVSVGRYPLDSIQVLEPRVLLSANAIQVADINGGVGTVRSFQFSTGTTTFSAVVNSTNSTIQSLLGVEQEFVGLGDFNGDGFQDVVIKTPGGLISPGVGFPAPVGQWIVLLNDGSNQFTAGVWDNLVPVASQTGTNSWTDFQVGDFSGDGKADVLARVKATGEWYLWTSTGSAFTKSSSPVGVWNTGFQWRDALIGDFDHDGKMDLVGRQVSSDATAVGAVDKWYIGLGSRMVAGTLGTVDVSGNQWWNITNTDAKATIANAVVGDFNGNGDDDLAIRSVLSTAANGSRQSDWMVVSTGAIDTTITFPTSAWTTWTHQSATGIQTQWTDVQAADLNGDGKDDLIGRTASGEWWGTLGSATLPASTSAVLIANWSASAYKNSTAVIADFTGDNKADLVVRDAANDRWLIAQFGTSTYASPTAAGGATSLSSWNPAQKRTFAGGSRNSGQSYAQYQRSTLGVYGSSDPLALLENDATLYLGSSPALATYGGDSGYTIGRLNANGNFDYENYGGAVVIPTLPALSTLPTMGSIRTFTADFTGDGLADILTQFASSTSWYLSVNLGNAFSAPTLTSLPTSFTGSNAQIRVADFDGDNKADLLVMTETSSTQGRWDLYTYTGTSGSLFSSAANVANPTKGLMGNPYGGAIVGGEVGDFDGDGKADITITMLRPDGTPNFDTYVAYSNGTSTWDIYLKWTRSASASGVTLVNPAVFTRFGDFNGDGKDDFAGLQNLTTYTFVNMQIVVTTVGQLVVAPITGTRSSTLSTSTTTNINSGFVLTNSGTYTYGGPIFFETGRFTGASGVPDALDDIFVGQDSSTVTTSSVGYVWRSQGSVGGTPAFGSTPAFSGNVPYGAGTTFARSKIADVDHDGHDDIVWQHIGYAGQISLMVQSNIATLTSPFATTVTTGIQGLAPVSTTIGRLRSRG